MATKAGQIVGAGPVMGARRARPGQWVDRRLPAAPVVPESVINLPDYWNSFPAPGGGYVGPLMGQMFLAVGHGAVFDGVVLRIGGAVLIGAAGKVFAFSSRGSAGMWAAISRARAVREVELSQAMEPEKRAAWLAVKREKLAKEAKNRINAAARAVDPAIAAALIADADFALAKWGHY